MNFLGVNLIWQPWTDHASPHFAIAAGEIRLVVPLLLRHSQAAVTCLTRTDSLKHVLGGGGGGAGEFFLLSG